MQELELMVTLWPSFPHFERFANDPRLTGIRLNSAMMSGTELDGELEIIEKTKPAVPLYYDIKGRQLRISEVHFNEKYLDISLNHPISVDTPTPVLFKAGMDDALLERVEEDGKRLIFHGGPEYMVRAGESLHIRDASLKVGGPQFTEAELEKIKKVKQAGFKRWYLSYVENQPDVDEFMNLVGPDAEVFLKIENKKGLAYVERDYKKKPNITLIAARGDMYVEIDKPHEMLAATKLIIGKDPQAQAGSRILLSVIHEPVPSCADLSELAWLYDIGYRNMLLCDELCLKEDLLATAVNVFEAFKEVYPSTAAVPEKQNSNRFGLPQKLFRSIFK